MRRPRSVNTGRLALTAKGKVADRPDAIECIRHGLAQARKGMGRSVDEVFDDIEKECANPRG